MKQKLEFLCLVGYAVAAFIILTVDSIAQIGG